MRAILILASATSLALSAAAFAQTTTTTTTTVVTEEPATRTIVEVPSDVRTYVTKQETPSVVLEGKIIAGEALPDSVEVQVIPDYDGYGYAVVNGQRVIIDPSTRSIIEVYE